MFVTSDQPRTILVCFFVGVIIGLYYEPFYLIKLFFKNKVVGHVINVIWLTSSVLFFVIVSTIYHFENIREYMILSIFASLFLYLFSLHKCIAFFSNKVYNNIIKLFLKVKRVYDRIKKEKGVFRSSIGVNNALVHSVYVSHLSNSRNSNKKKRNKTAW